MTNRFKTEPNIARLSQIWGARGQIWDLGESFGPDVARGTIHEQIAQRLRAPRQSKEIVWE